MTTSEDGLDQVRVQDQQPMSIASDDKITQLLQLPMLSQPFRQPRTFYMLVRLSLPTTMGR
jgi:hypothetical protein